jgi:hypothetical protein
MLIVFFHDDIELAELAITTKTLGTKLLLLRSHDFWPRSQVKLILLVMTGKVVLYSSKVGVLFPFWVSFQKVKSQSEK